jgi:hypothetical protein
VLQLLADEKRVGNHGTPGLANRLEPHERFDGEPDKDLKNNFLE